MENCLDDCLVGNWSGRSGMQIGIFADDKERLMISQGDGNLVREVLAIKCRHVKNCSRNCNHGY